MLWKALFLSVAAVAADSKCERLKATLTYTQEKAPRDLSSVVSWLCYPGVAYIR
jgi:hypothetical protein